MCVCVHTNVPNVRVDAGLGASLLELEIAVGGGDLLGTVRVPRDVVGRALDRIGVLEDVDGLCRGQLLDHLRAHVVEVELVNVDGVVLADHVLNRLSASTNTQTTK